jgi:UDP-N-acetylglucosamine--dolichyl-phosphate N-acetylglucosaminephosphotransferase
MFEILAAALVSFLFTVFFIPKWIRKARQFGLVGKDMNKHGRPEVAEAGGIVVIFGLLAGILSYIFIDTFFLSTGVNEALIFAVLLTVLLAGFLGFIDDVLGWKKGLKRWQKPILTLPMAIPLMVINAGESAMNIPLFGTVDFGIIYPLVIIPIGIVGAANGFNMLAGFNGLEAGMGAIALGTLGTVSLLKGELWLAAMAFAAVASLLAFLVFNWNPAKIFPGDSLTYGIGALIAVIAILGNMEKIGLILFIPFIIDALWSLLPEAKGSRKVEAFGKVNKDNSLEMPYKRILSFEHFGIFALKKLKKKVYETDVTLFFLVMELFLSAVVFGFFVQ